MILFHAFKGFGAGVVIAMAVALPIHGPMAAPASTKNCYDGITGNGCPWKIYFKEKDLRGLSCQNLAHMRNQTYHENGYCFRKAEVKAQYDTKGCKWPVQQLVPLNKYERANITLVRKVEASKRC